MSVIGRFRMPSPKSVEVVWEQQAKFAVVIKVAQPVVLPYR